MRKILLSMALVAASGAYVGYEDLAASAPPVATAASLPEGSPATAPKVRSLTVLPLPATSATSSAVISSTREAPASDAAVSSPAAASAAVPSIPLPRLRPTEVPAAETTSAAAQVQTVVRYSDGTFKGIDANAYYGHVQVQAIIKGGQITTVNILDYPSDRRTSRNINSQALPILEQEAIQAQSANIDGVSGATLTSEAFAQSLDAALSAATGGNNA